MRPPATMDIIQIDANNACHKRCSNCTRAIAHQPSKVEMSPLQVQQAIESMAGWYRPGKVLGLIGGEVTLHSQFEELCRVFREHWNPERRVSIGREPIGDLNAFANERLYDRTSGRGLWTSLGAGFYRHMEAIFDTFDHFNINTHEAGGRHQSLFIHRDDYCAQTGMSQEEWERNRDACWVQNLWSATINDKGAYPCEVMATIDRLFYDGAHAWPVEQGWWERTPADFGAMLDLCNHCALAQPGPAQVDALERDAISPKNELKLLQIGSPAVKAKRFEAYPGDTTAEKRLVDTKDSYVADNCRVGPEHTSILPKKLSCVIVCVGRAEHLEQTLAHNAAQVDELIVVTTSDDVMTKGTVLVASGSYPNVKLAVSDACYENDFAFNKGAMLNAGLRSIGRADWIVFTDADCFLSAGLRGFVSTHALNPGCLYYSERRTNQEVGDPKINAEPNGYFQLWNVRAEAVRGRWIGDEPVVAETFCSAGGVDSWFMQQWYRKRRIFIPELAVVHIDHGPLGLAWNGPKFMDGEAHWMQTGVLSAEGYNRLIGPLPGKSELILTDTLHGKQAHVEVDFEHGGFLPETVVKSNGQGGLLFCGEDIGGCHIHVACRLKIEKVYPLPQEVCA